MRNFFLLRSLLVIGNSLSISIGFLNFFIVSVSLIFSGLPREISIELATAASLGTGSFIAFIDSLIGISSSSTKTVHRQRGIFRDGFQRLSIAV